MAKEKMPVLYVSVADGARAELVRAVLEYEAASRGLSRGQALLELVREAADLASYPPEVLDLLAEIGAGRRARAVEASLAAGRGRVA